MKLGPIVFILLSIGLFVFLIRPVNKEVNELAIEQEELSEVLGQVRQLNRQFANLETIYREGISTTNENKLKKLLPDGVDNVRLILETADIARSHGLALKNISVNTESIASGQEEQTGLNVDPGIGFGTISIGFGVTATYEQFKFFMSDLERSLRIMDVRELQITGGQENDVNEFQLIVDTYWLR